MAERASKAEPRDVDAGAALRRAGQERQRRAETPQGDARLRIQQEAEWTGSATGNDVKMRPIDRAARALRASTKAGGGKLIIEPELAGFAEPAPQEGFKASKKAETIAADVENYQQPDLGPDNIDQADLISDDEGPVEINPADLEPIEEVEVIEEPEKMLTGRQENIINPAIERERAEALQRELDAMVEVVDEEDSRTARFLNGLRGGLAAIGLRAARILGQGRDAVTGAVRGTVDTVAMSGALAAEDAREAGRKVKAGAKSAGRAVAGTARGLAAHAREEVTSFAQDMGDNLADAGSWTLTMAVDSLERVKHGVDHADEVIERAKTTAKEGVIAGAVGAKNAYDRGAQRLGEGIVGGAKATARGVDRGLDAVASGVRTGVEVGAKTALEVGLIIPRTAIGGARMGAFVGGEALAVAKNTAVLVGRDLPVAAVRGGVEVVKAADRVGTRVVRGSVDAVRAADRLGDKVVRETASKTQKAASWGIGATIRGLLGLGEVMRKTKEAGDAFDANAIDMAEAATVKAINKANELGARASAASSNLVDRVSGAWSKVWETRFGLAAKSVAEKKRLSAENAELAKKLEGAMKALKGLDKERAAAREYERVRRAAIAENMVEFDDESEAS